MAHAPTYRSNLRSHFGLRQCPKQAKNSGPGNGNGRNSWLRVDRVVTGKTIVHIKSGEELNLN